MFSDRQTIDEAIQDFTMLRNHAPYRYGGVWYVARVSDGYRAYRTTKAAAKNSIDTQVHKLSWGVLQN